MITLFRCRMDTKRIRVDFKKLKFFSLRMKEKNQLALTFRKSNDLFKIPKIFKTWINVTLRSHKSLYNLSKKSQEYYNYKTKLKIFNHIFQSYKERKIQNQFLWISQRKKLRTKAKIFHQLQLNCIRKKRKRERTKLMRVFLGWKK